MPDDHNPALAALINCSSIDDIQEALGRLRGEIVVYESANGQLARRCYEAWQNRGFDALVQQHLVDVLSNRCQQLQEAHGAISVMNSDKLAAARLSELEGIRQALNNYLGMIRGDGDGDMLKYRNLVQQVIDGKLRSVKRRRTMILVIIAAFIAISWATATLLVRAAYLETRKAFGDKEWALVIAKSGKATPATTWLSLGVAAAWQERMRQWRDAARQALGCEQAFCEAVKALDDRLYNTAESMLAQVQAKCPNVYSDMIARTPKCIVRVFTSPDTDIWASDAQNALLYAGSSGTGGRLEVVVLTTNLNRIVLGRPDFYGQTNQFGWSTGQVVEINAPLKGQPGSLVVTGDPKTEVWEGGRRLGWAGQRIGGLECGSHAIEFKREGYRSVKTQLVVSANGVGEYSAPILEPCVGVVEVKAEAVGLPADQLPGRVRVRFGTNVWQSVRLPALYEQLLPGEYEVELRADNYEEPGSRKIYVGADSTNIVLFRLTPKLASLRIAIFSVAEAHMPEPEWIEMAFSTNRWRQLRPPFLVADLAPGQYEVNIRVPGCEPVKGKSLFLSPGKTNEAMFELRPVRGAVCISARERYGDRMTQMLSTPV